MITCPACTAKRCHTEEEWKNHPTRGHGYVKEQGWSSPEAESISKAESARCLDDEFRKAGIKVI